MLHLTTQSFKSELQKSPAPAVVMFYAIWCGKCAMMRPVIEDLEARYLRKYPNAPKIRFFEVDTSESELLAVQYQIDLIPTFLIFRDQEVVAVMQGVIPADAFEKRLLQLILNT